MGRETQKKGDLGVAMAILKFTQLGYDVSVPLSESAAYDLIVDTGTELKRVQVRYTTKRSVGLRRIHSNSTGYVVKHRTAGSYDWLLVARSDGKVFLVPEEDINSSTVYTPRPAHEV